ncbi:MAG: hypothetical protein PUD50_03675 [Eubacteriales bacterium]|nr:hypothetical protein [Eubacteriales bacterium]
MDRKTRTWLIVLVALLIAAITGGVVFKSQLSAAEAKLASAQALEQESAQAVEALRAEMDEKQQALDEQTVSNAALSEQIAQLQAEAESLQSQIDKKQQELEAQIDSNAAESEASQAQFAAAQEEIAMLKAQAEQSQTQIDELTDKLALQDAYAQALEAQLAQESAASETLRQDLAQSQADVASLTASLQELEPVTEENKALIASLESELQQAYASLATLEAQIVQPTPDATPAQTAAISKTWARGARQLISIQERMAALLHSDDEELSDASKLEGLAQLLTELKACVAALTADQETAPAPDDAALEAQLSAANDVIANLQQQIQAGDATIRSLEEQIAQNAQEQETLKQEIALAQQEQAKTAEQEAAIADMNKELSALNDTVSLLQNSLDAEKDTVAQLQTQLEAALAQYERVLAELRAYRISRELAAGEAYTSTETVNAITIAKDGVTGIWKFTNMAISGHDVVLEIIMDDQVLYTSQPIAPGESIDTIVLNAPLATGTYDAMVFTKTYAADGSYQSGTRTPITLIVE